jgi:HPt (histidine-containing phosphotransfer) domain-containing protein
VADTLDVTVLAELREAVGDDPVFVDQLVDTYLEEAPGFLAAIDAAVASRDAAALVVPAHTLKGNSNTMGATALGVVAKVLEDRGRAGSLEGAEADAAEARAEFGRVEAALAAARARRWTA